MRTNEPFGRSVAFAASACAAGPMSFSPRDGDEACARHGLSTVLEHSLSVSQPLCASDMLPAASVSTQLVNG